MVEELTVENLPLNEKIHIKKDFLGYRLVYPIRNEDGKLNLVNFLVGGKRNLAILIMLLLLFSLFSYGVYELTRSMRDVVENPCDYCVDCLVTNPANAGLNVIGLDVIGGVEVGGFPLLSRKLNKRTFKYDTDKTRKTKSKV